MAFLRVLPVVPITLIGCTTHQVQIALMTQKNDGPPVAIPRTARSDFRKPLRAFPMVGDVSPL
jgi:hypothetical protein